LNYTFFLLTASKQILNTLYFIQPHISNCQLHFFLHQPLQVQSQLNIFLFSCTNPNRMYTSSLMNRSLQNTVTAFSNLLLFTRVQSHLSNFRPLTRAYLHLLQNIYFGSRSNVTFSENRMLLLSFIHRQVLLQFVNNPTRPHFTQ